MVPRPYAPPRLAPSFRPQHLRTNATNPTTGKLTTVSPCLIKPYHASGTTLDTFTLGTLTSAAGMDLDAKSYNTHSNRYNGGVIIVSISYDNTNPWSGVVDTYKKTDTKNSNIHYQYTISYLQDTSFKTIEAKYFKYPSSRSVLNRHGIRIFVVQAGQLGQFDATQLLLQLTTSLTLLAIANTVVDLLMM